MGPTILVDENIKAGETLLNELDAAHLKIRTAFWAKLPSREWRLFLISPEVDRVGPRDVYAKVQKIVNEKKLGPLFSVISLVGPKDAVARSIRNSLMHGVSNSTSTVMLPGPEGDEVEEAYVYRST